MSAQACPSRGPGNVTLTPSSQSFGGANECTDAAPSERGYPESRLGAAQWRGLAMAPALHRAGAGP